MFRLYINSYDLAGEQEMCVFIYNQEKWYRLSGCCYSFNRGIEQQVGRLTSHLLHANYAEKKGLWYFQLLHTRFIRFSVCVALKMLRFNDVVAWISDGALK